MSVINGAGDPRSLSPVPDGTVDKVFVDDTTGLLYTAKGLPATWQPVDGVVASYDATAQSANVAQVTLFTPSTTGWYQIHCYAVVTTAATTSSTLPTCQAQWNDPDSATQEAFLNIAPSVTTNTVGTTSLAGGSNAKTIYAQAGQPVNFRTNGYASSGTTAMQYAVHVVVTRLT